MHEPILVCAAGDPNWLEMRLTGIGASEMPTAMGLNGFQSALELWLLKLERGEPFEGNEPAFWGNHLEEPVASAFSMERYANRPVGMVQSLYRHPEHSWMLATPDYWTVRDGKHGKRGGLELKTCSIYRAEDWEKGVPVYYLPQVQQQIEVMGWDFSSVACLIGGQELVWCDIERDDEMIANIIAAGNAFWAMVQDEVRPEPDGSDSAGNAVRMIYPNINDAVTVQLGIGCTDQTIEYNALGKQIKELTKHRKSLQQSIELAMGEAEIGLLPGMSKVWKRSVTTVGPRGPQDGYTFKSMKQVKGS